MAAASHRFRKLHRVAFGPTTRGVGIEDDDGEFHKWVGERVCGIGAGADITPAIISGAPSWSTDEMERRAIRPTGLLESGADHDSIAQHREPPV